MQMRIRPAVVLFGDSITQFGFGEVGAHVGWASLLSSAYQRRADVLNRGFSGYNTQHALELVPRVFGTNEEGFLFCTLFFGANDAALPGERQHVSVEEYGENLGNIIISIRERTQQEGSQDKEQASSSFPIIIMTPPPVDADMWKKELENEEYDRTNESARAYGQAAKTVAKELDCPVLDTWELLGGDSKDYSKHLCDGLHLNDSGNQLVYQGLMDLLKKDLPHLCPREMVDGEYQGPGVEVEEKLWSDLC